ncbi:hypothetical protein MED193_03020 [Roseobacter sp. MED193]|nr:hypothetical protein MED193_03020 [Roseobacter sp. MED193]
MILCVGMRARKISIWAFSSLSYALCRGMKNWFRKTRRRDKIECILPSSTARFRKCSYIKLMGLAYILAPLSGKTKMLGPADGRHQAGAGGLSGLLRFR